MADGQQHAVVAPAPDIDAETNARRGAHLAEWLGRAGRVLSVVEPDNAEHAFDLAVDELNRAQMHYAQAGFYFLFAKEGMDHGEFGGYLERHGIGRRAAQESMQIAYMLQRLPESAATKVVGLPKKKALALARMEPEQVELLIEADEHDEIARMTRRDIEAFARRESTRRDTVEKENETLRNQLSNRVEVPQTAAWPEWVTELRATSAALSEKAMLSLDDLQRLQHHLDGRLDLDAEQATETAIAATSLYHQANAIYARAGQVLAAFDETLGAHVEQDESRLPIATAEELKRRLMAREIINAEHDAERAAREIRSEQQQAGAKRGRGRPRKVAS